MVELAATLIVIVILGRFALFCLFLALDWLGI
jgi:hypothetical protein